MSNTDELIARLRHLLDTYYLSDVIDDGLTEAADALTAQAATIAELAAQIEVLKLAADNAEGMAGCMAMFRNDMIEAGVITDAVAPMFMTEAILSKLSALRANAERLNTLLSYASAWARSAGHGDDCFVSDHYEGDPGNRCNCGLDGLMSAFEDAAMQSGKAVES